MKTIEEILSEATAGIYDNNSLLAFKKLKDFIDATLAESFSVPDATKTQFLISNFFKIRDILSNEINQSVIKFELKNDIMKIIHDEINKDSPPNKKKEELG